MAVTAYLPSKHQGGICSSLKERFKELQFYGNKEVLFQEKVTFAFHSTITMRSLQNSISTISVIVRLD